MSETAAPYRTDPEMPAEFSDCFDAMQAASRRQRLPTLAERRADLRALHRLLVDNREALVEAVNADFGCRSRFETLMTELLQCQDAALDAIRRLPRWMKARRRHLDPLQYPLASAWTFPQPLGVVGIVVPWNFPLAMAFQPLICAFAAGNRAMVKMSENSEHSARLLQKLVRQYFPGDKLAFFSDGGGRGPQFTRLPFNHLFFTGSVRTGRAVMAQCAANLTPVTLELGGKSPAVVAADFDLRRAAERIIWSKLLNAGQICTNIDYLLLPEGREQAFVEQAQAVARRRYPDLCNGDYTAIIDQRQYDRLQALLEDARSKGARIIPLLPEQPGDPARRILPPQLLLDVSDDMRVMQEEIFGPLLPLRSYRDHAEALAQIDRLPSPLALYLFSNLQALQQFYLHNSLSGGVTLNDGLLHSSQHDLPFGGVGDSGMGHYHGHEGFLTFSKLRPVFRQSPWWRSVDLFMPPYRGLPSRILNLMLKLKS